VPYLKIFLIAYVWASIGGIYPLFAMTESPDVWQIIRIFSAMFFFILAITLPFDIRDYYTDRQANLTTIAVKLGWRKTKILALTFLSCYYLLMLTLGMAVWPITSFVALCAVLIGGASAHRKPVYYLGLLDGTIILHALIVYLSI
jgi:4-hydroxybenzoate polyprenyltransferase